MLRFREFVSINIKNTKLKSQIKGISFALINLTYIPSEIQQENQKAHDITLKYWKDPNSPLINWLQTHGIQIKPGIAPSFADGGIGRCYFLGDKVVKMTTSRVEANVAKMVAGRSDLPVSSIDVLYLDSNVYAILQHWVDTQGVPELIKQAVDYVTAIVDDHPEMTGFPSDINQQKQLCLEALTNNQGNKSLLPHMMLIISILANLYNATGYKHTDAGPTNIGMHQGKVVIPDLGPNQGKDFDQLSSLSQIRKNRALLGLPKHDSI